MFHTRRAQNKKAAQDFLAYLEASPSPFHAVNESKLRLINGGFTEIKERANWDGAIKRGGKYFYTRNQSSLVAFAVGGR